MAPDLALAARGLIAEAAATLRRAGVTEGRRESVRIWADLDGRSTASVTLEDEPVSAERAAVFRAAVGRRAAGEPLAYVTGWTGFRHLTLRVDRRALIARPETEGLVDLVLARGRGGRVVDVGTGTGCIALSLATEGTYARVVGVELSADALALAKENRRETGANVSLLRGDLTHPCASGSFDALVSNPPYLTTGEYAALDRSVRDWDPAVALAAGSDGLAAVRRLLEDGRRVLRPGGLLAMEIDVSRAAQCAALTGASGYVDVAIHADLFGRERYLLARRSDAE